MRILAVDPGDKRIGLAISDPSGTIANPMTVLHHISRPVDAAAIAALALEQGAGLIVVGQALDDNNEIGPSARKAGRMAEAIRLKCSIPVILWDESGSTQTARQAGIDLGVSRYKRRGHLDHLAATVILQSYLDSQP
ncbi:MAG TPA: Holliday junction resolvase RuvX [Anaerolineaceae bacterium]